jgi:hypothetical protein
MAQRMAQRMALRRGGRRPMSSRRIGIYVLLALSVVAVYVIVRRLPIVLISAVVAAAVAWYVSRRQVPAEAEERIEPVASVPEWIDHLRDLAKLDSVIREKACPESVTAKLEEVIDTLRRLMPDLNENHMGSELTWTVNRMATDYLSRIVRPYVELSSAGMVEHQDELLTSLDGLEDELENIEGLVRDAKVGDFKAKAAFLRARFLDDKL